jgi:site-specific DNA-methyltransferase (adenine-specific)
MIEDFVKIQSKAFNMDCMEGMREYPDKYFDLAVVDPPYGVGSIAYMPSTREYAVGGYIDKYDITIATIDMNQRKKLKVDVVHNGNSETTIRNFGDENVSPSPQYFKELMRISKHQIIWGGNYFLLPPTRGFVVWRKPSVTEDFSMAMCEYAWTSFNDNAKWISLSPQGTKADPRMHPTQKPVALYDWIYKNYLPNGGKVVDTHLGSGSNRIAAHKAGNIEFTAYEIDKDYFDGQEKRFKAFVSQLKLF